VHRGVFRNRMTRDEMLGAEAMATIERDWRRLLQKIGVAFHHPEALQHFRYARYLDKVRRA
jgi:trimethylamine--corrinoid protein Co-methyltransferase